MAQALGAIAQAYSTPGQPLKTGIVSVADETCAILAFGGALAALTYARSTGIGDCSLLGGQIRFMGWTLRLRKNAQPYWVGGSVVRDRFAHRLGGEAARR